MDFKLIYTEKAAIADSVTAALIIFSRFAYKDTLQLFCHNQRARNPHEFIRGSSQEKEKYLYPLIFLQAFAYNDMW